MHSQAISGIAQIQSPSAELCKAPAPFKNKAEQPNLKSSPERHSLKHPKYDVPVCTEREGTLLSIPQSLCAHPQVPEWISDPHGPCGSLAVFWALNHQ